MSPLARTAAERADRWILAGGRQARGISAVQDSGSGLAHPGFAGGDCGFAFEQEAGALDDRHVDHLAVDGNRADTVGERLVVGGDDAAGVVDFLSAGGGTPR